MTHLPSPHRHRYRNRLFKLLCHLWKHSQPKWLIIIDKYFIYSCYDFCRSRKSIVAMSRCVWVWKLLHVMALFLLLSLTIPSDCNRVIIRWACDKNRRKNCHDFLLFLGGFYIYFLMIIAMLICQCQWETRNILFMTNFRF